MSDDTYNNAVSTDRQDERLGDVDSTRLKDTTSASLRRDEDDEYGGATDSTGISTTTGSNFGGVGGDADGSRSYGDTKGTSDPFNSGLEEPSSRKPFEETQQSEGSGTTKYSTIGSSAQADFGDSKVELETGNDKDLGASSDTPAEESIVDRQTETRNNEPDSNFQSSDPSSFDDSNDIDRDLETRKQGSEDDIANTTSAINDSFANPETNITNPDSTTNLPDEDDDMSEHAPETRLGVGHETTPYLGGTEHGSGTTAGVGHGNKTAADPTDLDTSTTRFDNAHHTAPYSGGTEHGSGTTGGPGFGNKTSDGHNDSKLGKLMETAGKVLKKEDMVEKGHEKRVAAGYSAE